MPDRVVDFRSDTLTQPTDEMREAMRAAEVGDDAYGEDPTVQRLQEIAAKKVGTEASLFVPSGTMGNEIAVFLHTKRQGEIILEREAHIFLYECGGPAMLSGVQVQTIQGQRGVFTPHQVAEAMRDADDVHVPRTTMVGIENTHNVAGGTVWTAAQTQAVARVAHEHGVPVHLDGARIFNSAVAQDVSPASLVKPVDSVMFCVSKGLSAPVGSLLCGSQEFVTEAIRVRRLLGGGLRQAGVIAAAGIVSLEKMVDRLKDDHVNARRLAAGLAKLPGVSVDLNAVQTNIIFIDVSATGRTAKDFETRADALGVKCLSLDARRVRFVTHRHVRREDVDWTLERLGTVTGRPTTTARQTTTRTA